MYTLRRSLAGYNLEQAEFEAGKTTFSTSFLGINVCIHSIHLAEEPCLEPNLRLRGCMLAEVENDSP